MLKIFKKYLEYIIPVIVIIAMALFNRSAIYIAAGLFFIAIISFVENKYLVYLSVFLFLIFPGDFNENLRTLINYFNVLILIIFYIREKGFKIELKSIPLGFFLLIVLNILSLFISTLHSTNISFGFEQVIRFVIFSIIVLCIYTGLNKYRDLVYLINTMILVSVVIAYTIIISFLKSSTELYILQSSGVIQEGGFSGNVAAPAAIMVFGILLSIYKLKYFRKNIKLVFSFFLLSQIVGLLLTNSRAAFMAGFIAVMVFLFITKRKLFYSSFLTIAALVIIIFSFSPFLSDLVFNFFRLDRVLENTRYPLWDIAWHIFLQHPIWGVGPGNFADYMYGNLPVMLGSFTESQIRWVNVVAVLGHPHNFYLFRAAELGIVGLITGIMMPYLIYLYSFRILKNLKSKNHIYYIVIVSISILTGFLYRAMFESTGINTYGWVYRDLPLWLIFLIVMTIYKKFYNLDTKRGNKINKNIKSVTAN